MNLLSKDARWSLIVRSISLVELMATTWVEFTRKSREEYVAITEVERVTREFLTLEQTIEME